MQENNTDTNTPSPISVSTYPLQHDKQQHRTAYTVQPAPPRLTKASVGGGGGAGGGGTGMVEGWAPADLAKKSAQQNTKCKDPEINKSAAFGGYFLQTNPVSNRLIYYFF